MGGIFPPARPPARAACISRASRVHLACISQGSLVNYGAIAQTWEDPNEEDEVATRYDLGEFHL